MFDLGLESWDVWPRRAVVYKFRCGCAMAETWAWVEPNPATFPCPRHEAEGLRLDSFHGAR